MKARIKKTGEIVDVKLTLKMRRININNPEEIKKFKMETSGFVSTYGFPY